MLHILSDPNRNLEHGSNSADDAGLHMWFAFLDAINIWFAWIIAIIVWKTDKVFLHICEHIFCPCDAGFVVTVYSVLFVVVEVVVVVLM